MPAGQAPGRNATSLAESAMVAELARLLAPFFGGQPPVRSRFSRRGHRWRLLYAQIMTQLLLVVAVRAAGGGGLRWVAVTVGLAAGHDVVGGQTVGGGLHPRQPRGLEPAARRVRRARALQAGHLCGPEPPLLEPPRAMPLAICSRRHRRHHHISTSDWHHQPAISVCAPR